MGTIQAIPLIALLLSMLAATASVVALESAKNGTLSVPLMHNNNHVHKPHWEYYRTLQKYNLEIPARLQEIISANFPSKGIAEDGESSIPAISQLGDLLWLAPVDIGTPPQRLYLDLDTGSTDTWVFSSDTDPDDVAGQALYNPGKSSTSKLIENCSWSIMYGDFSTSKGICYRDTFTLGDIDIEGMTIESATNTSSMFTDTRAMSGLVGLAWSSLAQTVPVQPCLVDFLPQVLHDAVFTVDFVHNGTGSFNFGYIDDNLHVDSLTYVDIDTSNGFWAVLHKGFRMSGETIKYEFTKPKTIIIDTGSTLLFAPEAAADIYYNSVPGGYFSYEEYAYVLPCDQDPPDFIIEISDNNGKRIETVVPGQYIIYSHLDDNLCFGGVQSLGSFSGMDGIFGDIYLKSGFAVFDIANKQFGMAAKTSRCGFLMEHKLRPTRRVQQDVSSIKL